MKAQLGLHVQHRITNKVYEISRIHPYLREIQLKCLPDTHWDFEVEEDDFIDSVDDYQALMLDGELVDIDGFEITTENYIVV